MWSVVFLLFSSCVDGVIMNSPRYKCELQVRKACHLSNMLGRPSLVLKGDNITVLLHVGVCMEHFIQH